MGSLRLYLLLLLAIKWGLLFVPSHSSLYNDVLALKAFKKAIIEDPLSVLSDWNTHDGDPCSWNGVLCSKYHDHVLSLNLSNSSLKGFLAPELASLSSLQELILGNNLFLGTIPKEIGMLKSLTVLDLSLNRFSGPIPAEIGNLSSIQKINLHSNGLTGTVPPELGRLETLVELRLDRNRLHGPIPGSNNVNFSASRHDMFASNTNGTGLCQFPRLKVGDFSYNFFVGKMPRCLMYLPRSSFQGNCFQDKHSILQRSSRTYGEMLKNVSKFSRRDLEVACEDFSNIIGSSSDGMVYKGTIEDGLEIAVIYICVSVDQWTNYHEFTFQTKVADLARVNHKNTANLLGYCKESDPFTRMLVFEYASNGTLYEHLHYGEGCQLSWLRRMRIAVRIARGLRYLHTELRPPFALSELNSSTVYLTEDFFPKIVDFESWKMIFSKSGKNSGYITTGGSLHGFLGSFAQRHMDIQDNTYSFGVLLLEIISGRLPYCKDRGCLVDWAMQHLQHPEEIGKLVDPELKNVMADDLAMICSVVSLCIEPDPSKRPSMQIISGVLENGIDTSDDAILRCSSLVWAELALAS